MMKTLKKENLLFIVMIFYVLLNIGISLKACWQEQEMDLSAYYYAANIILDREIANTEVYNLGTMVQLSDSYGIYKPMPFVYSLASAYIMSPIALMPYREAKLVWSLLGVIFYLGAITIFFRIGKISRLWFAAGVIILLSMIPFTYSQAWLQSNSLLIFFIALAVFTAVKGRPFTSGFLIGIASIFKLFPFALAVYLGLKNWRIFAACAAVFVASFLIPGSLEWFHAIQKIHPYGDAGINTPVFTWLNQNGHMLFFLYATVITGITAFVIYKNREAGYPVLLSFAVPATFLVNPYVDYHHLTMLALSYSYILCNVEVLPRWFLVTSTVSFMLINTQLLYFPYFNPISLIVLFGVFLIWISFYIVFTDKNIKTAKYCALVEDSDKH